MSTDKAMAVDTGKRDYELWALLDATVFAISRLRELELAQFHLTIEQAAVLKLISTMDRGITVKEIKDATLRQQHTISILLNRMARSGLVTRRRKAGERESRITMTKGGRDLIDGVTTTSLRKAFSAVSAKEKRQLACSLRALHKKARDLLVPDMPPFMRQIAGRGSSEPAGRSSAGNGRFSDYMVWSSLDAARFAISRLRELELARFGVTVEQSSILKVLSDRGESLTVKDLEDITLRQHHSVSTLLNRMIRLGLVAREKKEGERSRRVFVTNTGRDLFSRITTAAIDVTFSVLTEVEKQQMEACLRSLRRKARALLGAPGEPVSMSA
jgi:DNA-binding MarR family transcriptional regulator